VSNALAEPVGEDLVRAYLNDIGKYALITAAQEIELAKAIEDGTTADARLEFSNKRLAPTGRDALQHQVDKGKVAQRTFVEANLRLVVSIARRYQGYGLPLLDMIQDGNIGLLNAVQKFDWRRGFKFSTYATWWIRQAVQRGLADRSRTIRLPAHVTEAVNNLRRSEAALAGTLGREPTDQELGDDMRLAPERVHHYRRIAMEPISLSAAVGPDGDAELNDFLADEHNAGPLDAAVQSQSVTEMRAILANLDDRERRVIELRFGFGEGAPQTLEQVGRVFNLTRERIRQIEAKAIAKLRHPAWIADLQGQQI
jgi:RNA polymerase sigma factor (sigma-70 family)